MKKLLLISLAAAGLAGCAISGETSQQASDTKPTCINVVGAVHVACQNGKLHLANIETTGKNKDHPAWGSPAVRHSNERPKQF